MSYRSIHLIIGYLAALVRFRQQRFQVSIVTACKQTYLLGDSTRLRSAFFARGYFDGCEFQR